MIVKLIKSYPSVANANRDVRTDSIDSIGSTIEVDSSVWCYNAQDDAPHRRMCPTTSDEENESDLIMRKTNVKSSHFDIDVPAHHNSSLQDNRVRQALASIVVLDSHLCPKVRTLLHMYNGHLIDMGKELLGALRVAAPDQLAARVGDCNENLFYEMQGHKKDLWSIIVDNIDSNHHAFDHQLHKDIQTFEDSLRQSLNHGNLTYRGSYMRTENTIYQPAHVDYEYSVLNEYGHKLFLAFFPLTSEGTFLQLWNKPKNDHDGASSMAGKLPGQVVYIPYGKMLVVPAETVHGGGFKRGSSGNLRFHLYIEVEDETATGEKTHDDLLHHPTNKYTEENDRSRELCERFVDAYGLKHLLGVFFDE
ncbi:hypothetical protein HJC23_010233 [Cyclotella cryptica]|uniref:Uncharacterized protein n=1 Tax=Cyclotella cryptica TaxID=29204 RepID=A0ABD3Q156_9STRA|eukprot:CCRYP_009847-RA/>CCRYP_009847-RA protein AED:0.14 eAED:0.14 QI:0/-1/0/1/-1/1/1/0/362